MSTVSKYGQRSWLPGAIGRPQLLNDLLLSQLLAKMSPKRNPTSVKLAQLHTNVKVMAVKCNEVANG